MTGGRHGDRWNLRVPRNQGTIIKNAKNMMSLKTSDSKFKMHPATKHAAPF